MRRLKLFTQIQTSKYLLRICTTAWEQAEENIYLLIYLEWVPKDPAGRPKLLIMVNFDKVHLEGPLKDYFFFSMLVV